MLYELIYRSDAKPETSKEEIDVILNTARGFNKANNITGCLLYNNDQFLQLIEGEFTVLMELYERIKKDNRHQNLVLLHMQETTQRIYQNWTMAFQSLEQIEVKDQGGVTEFAEFESSKESALSKQLFEAVSKNMASN